MLWETGCLLNFRFFKVALYEAIVSGFHLGTNQYFNVNMSQRNRSFLWILLYKRVVYIHFEVPMCLERIRFPDFKTTGQQTDLGVFDSSMMDHPFYPLQSQGCLGKEGVRKGWTFVIRESYGSLEKQSEDPWKLYQKSKSSMYRDLLYFSKIPPKKNKQFEGFQKNFKNHSKTVFLNPQKTIQETVSCIVQRHRVFRGAPVLLSASARKSAAEGYGAVSHGWVGCTLSSSKLLGGGNSYMFYFHPYLGKTFILTPLFQMGSNHQLDLHGNGNSHFCGVGCFSFFECAGL